MLTSLLTLLRTYFFLVIGEKTLMIIMRMAIKIFRDLLYSQEKVFLSSFSILMLFNLFSAFVFWMQSACS